MKKLILLGIAIMMMLLSGCSKEADISSNTDTSFEGGVQQTLAPTLAPEDSDFRNLKWGMTLEEVILTEGAGFKQVDDNVIRYSRIREEGYPADADYEFTDNMLSGATFFIQPDYSDLNEYVDNYEELIEKFTQRYGQPASSEKEWKTENLEGARAQYGQAVLDGNLIWRTGWNLERTDINLVLSRRGAAVCIGIRYSPAA